MTDLVEPSKRVETATDKLRALRRLCEAASQPFYVEILDEALAAFSPPNCDGILEVRPCIGVNGHVVSYDLCPPIEDGAKAGPVIASVFSEDMAEQFARLWNTRQSTLEIKEYRDALSWQPIETAPKDGSRVIVWNERYAAPVSAEMNGTLWAVHGYKLNIQPTHWMPLPKPPSRAALNHHEGSE